MMNNKDAVGQSNDSSGPTEEKARLGPPPRWLRCPRRGNLIGGKFVPFKTPLCELYDFHVAEQHRFPVDMLFERLKTLKVKVGLWIDLTNTDRFYDKQEVVNHGCIYKKVNCRGFGESPSSDQTAAFISICKEFISQHPLEAVGNVAALQARPPGIYKQDYIDELFKRFGDVEDAFPAPQLPDWCNENDPVLDENESESRPSNSQNAELPQFEPPLDGVTALPGGTEKKRLQKKCQSMCEWSKRGFPGSQPVSMDMQNIQFLKDHEYMVSWKADGTRYLMLIEDEGKIFMFDRDHNVFQVQHLRFPHHRETDSQNLRHLKETLIDGELVVDQVNEKDTRPRYLLYDIVRFEGQEVGKCKLTKRFQCLEKELIEPREKAALEMRINKAQEPFSVRMKHFEFARTGVEKFLSQEFQSKLPHEIDGLIFQPVHQSYTPGRCQEVLKWKPAEMNSVDFKLQIVKEQRPGMLPEWVGNLLVLGYEHRFAKIKLSKAIKELNGKIIECRYNNETSEWEFMRERKDKSYPNALNTAAGVCESIRNPVTKEYLIDLSKSYAKVPESHHHHRKRVHSQNGALPASNNISKHDSSLMPPPANVPHRANPQNSTIAS